MNNPVRILYLEDNPGDVELVRHTLQQAAMSYDLRVARDRAEYEAALAQGRFDLILSDYNLPGYDGLAAMRLARAKHPDVPFILLSGALGEDRAVDCVLRGATDYVLKQHLDRLVPAVLRALSEREARRKRGEAEKRLVQERELGETILNNMPGLFFLITEEGRFLRWNRQVETVSGYSGEEIARMHPLDFFADEHKELIAARISEVFKTGRSEAEADLLTKQGDRRPFYLTGAVVIVDGQRCLAGTGVDITERKQAEQERLRLSTAMEQANDVIIVTDREGVIQYVNPAFERVTGYSRQEALGQNPRMLKSGKQDRTFYEHMWQVLRAGEVWSGRLTNKRKDGTLYEVDKTISPVRDAEGKIVSYISVGRDVTREAQLESQLRQAQKMEAVGRLAGGVAHDFNNLLMAIMGYSELALKHADEGSPLRKHLDEVKAAGERAANLTRQLLAFSRKQTLQPRILNLNSIVANMEKMLRRLIGEDIALTTHLARPLNSVLADPGQIEQVLMNLVVNARDAMPHGGQLVIETANAELDQAYCAEHPEAKPGRYALLAVSDTGCGMTAEVKAHLFEPFFTTKEQGKGTGLGLATIYGIVAQSGGHITVESETGVGTTFKICLPVTAETVVPQAPRKGSGVHRGVETILLIEDEERVRRLLRDSLTAAGYGVLEAAHGAEAVEKYAHYPGPIHLLVSDMVMPGMSGRTAAQQLQSAHSSMKVLFMSGYTDTSILPRDMVLSGANFLQKPFTPQALTRKVRDMLDGR